ncbi:tetratricopeptide repeat protein [Aliiroseovarius marinus]|uniref:tetratricopeptide repeat protein n=1 Tax=Aliiroseovarius marinus TaxID=2500159 RepID=UPI003D7E4B5F
MSRLWFIACFVAALISAGVARGDECPISPDIADEQDALLSLAQNARSEAEARPAVNGMWLLWTRAPDERAQGLLDDGRARIRYADYEGAKAVLSELIAYCPSYAEGYNQRAFAHFLSAAYQAAYADLTRAMELNPRHVAAMSGSVLTLHALGRDEEAQHLLKDALKLNPWLPERRLLAKPKGTAL